MIHIFIKAAGGRRKERVNFMKEIIINQLDRFVPADEPEETKIISR